MTGLPANLISTIRTVQGANLIRFLPLDEISGATAKDYSRYATDGSYTSGVRNGARSIDGRPATELEGTGSGDTITCDTDFATDFPNSDVGTILVLAKVENVGVWTDGTSRQILELFNDFDNFIRLQRSSTNNIIKITIEADAESRQDGQLKGGSIGTDWFWYGVKWDLDTAMESYYILAYPGEQIINLLSDTHTKGFGAGDTLNNFTIGSTNSGGDIWEGFVSMAAVWNVFLTDAEIKTIINSIP